jgi:hypothetical protein
MPLGGAGTDEADGALGIVERDRRVRVRADLE